MVEGHECSGQRLPEAKRMVHPTDYPAEPLKRPEKTKALAIIALHSSVVEAEMV